ncbi:MAG: hypothetical protein HUU46_05760 [Candidatus Hydrogenedentes bacterium]|nr:hypothetical protein [Candidatus Hydrogenedentota bacterium]
MTTRGAFARYGAWVPLAIAAALAATGLGTGFVGDDAYHLLILHGERTPSVDGNLYSFMSGDPEVTQQFIESGPYPWWTWPEAKAVFYRPLTVALQRLDFAVFGNHAVYWHIHGIAWYLAMVYAWILIARRSLSAPIAFLAAILFAIDESHWMPAVWIANRNAVVACVPALFGLYAHLRWRENGWKPGLPLSIAGYVLGMFGGEAWLGMAAYVAAYELFHTRETIARRFLHLAPAATCAIAYAVAYKLSGYGAYGSGSYTQPLSALYFSEAPGRILALIGGLLLSSPVDAWAFFPQLRWALIAIGIFSLILFSGLLHRCWPGLDERDRAALRWLIPGGILSLLPVIAAFPMGRLLLGPSLAGSAVVAVLLRHWWMTRRKRRIQLAGVACAALAFVHIVVATIAWPAQSAIITFIGYWADRVFLEAPIDDARVSRQKVFLLAAQDPFTLMYPPIVRRLKGKPLPEGWHALSASMSDHVFTRTGANSFEFESARGPLVDGVFADILRGPDHPLAEGDTVSLGDARIIVLDVIDGRPRKIRVECDQPLDGPRYVFLQWIDYRLQLFPLPPVGESRVVRYAKAN